MTDPQATRANLFEDAKTAARLALARTGGGPEYEEELRGWIALLEAHHGERLSDADYVLVRDASSNRTSDLDIVIAARLRDNHGIGKP